MQPAPRLRKQTVSHGGRHPLQTHGCVPAFERSGYNCVRTVQIFNVRKMLLEMWFCVGLFFKDCKEREESSKRGNTSEFTVLVFSSDP